MSDAYDPLDYDNLARSVVNALMAQAACDLPPAEDFDGAGVYAIYYTGGFPAYRRVSAPACKTPIYVGKAIPSGGRKGVEEPTAGSALASRLRQHAKSIAAARNLELGEFRCRYLVVLPVWVGLAEQFLLSHFHPIWNVHIDGFGNHDVGKGRHAGKRSRWDIVHPGRAWAENLQAEETAEQVLAYLPRR